MESTGVISYSSDCESEANNVLFNLFQNCTIPEKQVLSNLGIFLTSKNLSRILFLDHIYQQIIDIAGVVVDFGTRWGQNMAVFSALRGMYEPFNRHRKIIGFDTFCGFPSISSLDGASDLMKTGNVSVTPGYESILHEIMQCQEKTNPISHVQKFEIVKGDASVEIDNYLNKNPETIVSLAFFDFDIYEPTKKCLSSIAERLVKGSIVAFDELNDHDSPGETLAVMHAIGLNKIRLKRYRYASRVSYFVME